VVCPDCLVELVDDLGATVRCRHCGREWPAHMHSCPNCLSELQPDPEAAVKALGDILAAGGHAYRPDGVPPFADGPACTLRRLGGRGSLAFIGPIGLVEAVISGPGGGAVAPLACRDHDGTVLFALVPYEPVEDALAAFGGNGAPLATYLRAEAGIDVRDETSAPVAAMRQVPGGFELVETGGAVLARLGANDVEQGGAVDDQWWLEPAPDVGRSPLRPLATVALVLAAKVMFGQPWPITVPRAREEPDGSEQWPYRL
jgi:hypothetical protein